MTLAQEILDLRDQGRTYNQIVDELGCSKSTVSYHVAADQKSKTYTRNLKNRVANPLVKKLNQFRDPTRKSEVSVRSSVPVEKALRDKVGDYQKVAKKYNTEFSTKDLLGKIGEDPTCYLSGRKIDLSDTSSYHLDHIEPRSKGGDNSLENLGLAEKHANLAKSNLSVDELLRLCEDILRNNGYTVTKSGE